MPATKASSYQFAPLKYVFPQLMCTIVSTHCTLLLCDRFFPLLQCTGVSIPCPLLLSDRLPQCCSVLVSPLPARCSCAIAEMAVIKSELVRPWQSRKQCLRQYHWHVKQRQSGSPVISCHVWFLPFLGGAWFTAMSIITLMALHLEKIMDSSKPHYIVTL